MRTRPAAARAAAPAYLGPCPTLAAGAKLLDEAEVAFAQADTVAAARALKSDADDKPFHLPPGHRFEGSEPSEIPIFPWQHPMEGEADRLSRELDLRPGLGNAGFCMLRLAPAAIGLWYIDWRNRERFAMTLPVREGRIRW